MWRDERGVAEAECSGLRSEAAKAMQVGEGEGWEGRGRTGWGEGSGLSEAAKAMQVEEGEGMGGAREVGGAMLRLSGVA